MTIRKSKAVFALIPAALALLAPASFAQQPHQNFVQHHHKLVAIGAGIATHHALKVAARNAKMHGQKLNFAERHPTMSAIGAGALTNHEIKAHTAH